MTADNIVGLGRRRAAWPATSWLALLFPEKF